MPVVFCFLLHRDSHRIPSLQLNRFHQFRRCVSSWRKGKRILLKEVCTLVYSKLRQFTAVVQKVPPTVKEPPPVSMCSAVSGMEKCIMYVWLGHCYDHKHNIRNFSVSLILPSFLLRHIENIQVMWLFDIQTEIRSNGSYFLRMSTEGYPTIHTSMRSSAGVSL